MVVPVRPHGEASQPTEMSATLVEAVPGFVAVSFAAGKSKLKRVDSLSYKMCHRVSTSGSVRWSVHTCPSVSPPVCLFTSSIITRMTVQRQLRMINDANDGHCD